MRASTPALLPAPSGRFAGGGSPIARAAASSSDSATMFVVLGIVLVFGWPLILVGLDLAWLLAVAGVGAIARIVLRRPWRVEAVARGERRQWFVQGFRAAGRHRDEVARQFEHGLDPASGADTLTT